MVVLNGTYLMYLPYVDNLIANDDDDDDDDCGSEVSWLG